MTKSIKGGFITAFFIAQPVESACDAEQVISVLATAKNAALGR
jgi:hypothetical protein